MEIDQKRLPRGIIGRKTIRSTVNPIEKKFFPTLLVKQDTVVLSKRTSEKLCKVRRWLAFSLGNKGDRYIETVTIRGRAITASVGARQKLFYGR